MPPKQDEPAGAELEVLKILWTAGPATVRQVLTHLHQKGRRIAYTTVLTMLSRLEAKGCVASDKRGLAYVYRATLSRDRFSRSRLKNLVRQLYDGAAAPLVLQLMQSQDFSPEEIAELRKLVDKLDNRK